MNTILQHTLYLFYIRKNFVKYFGIVFHIQFFKQVVGVGIGEELLQEK